LPNRPRRASTTTPFANELRAVPGGDGATRSDDGDGNGRLEPIELLELENAQLREALMSRIVIEQAKGILAERFRLDVGQAFELLRSAARSNRMRIRDLAAAVNVDRATPIEIELALRAARANENLAAERLEAD
jgi:hypothetical protein